MTANIMKGLSVTNTLAYYGHSLNYGRKVLGAATFSITELSIMTFSITTLSIRAYSITRFSITTLIITTFSIMNLIATLIIKDTKYDDT